MQQLIQSAVDLLSLAGLLATLRERPYLPPMPQRGRPPFRRGPPLPPKARLPVTGPENRSQIRCFLSGGDGGGGRGYGGV